MTKQPHPHFYADAIGKIIFENDMVKIDFITMQDHYENANTPPQKSAVVETTVMLSHAGFKQALDTMQKMATSLDNGKEPSKQEQLKAVPKT